MARNARITAILLWSASPRGTGTGIGIGSVIPEHTALMLAMTLMLRTKKCHLSYTADI
jgi:hypothetical protein